jgi:hypothetical protein
MLRARVCALLGFGLMFVPASTEAQELNFLVDSNIGVDTNVFRSSRNRQEDGFWEFSPRISLRETRDRLNYDLRYRPTYQAFFDTDGVDGWDHSGGADLEWRPTHMDSISYGGNIVSSRIVDQFGDTDLSLPPTDPDFGITEETDRDRIVRSKAYFGYNRSLDSVTSVRMDFNFEDLDFSDDNNVDQRSFSLSLSSSRVFNARTQVGLAATGRYRDGRGIESKNQFSSETLTGDFSLFFVRLLSPSITLSARAGPLVTRTEQDAPPFRDADPGTPQRDRTSDDRDVSFVANVSLEKSWRHSSASLSYTRFESGTGGSSTASIVDQVALFLVHRPTRRMRMTMNLSWNSRDTIDSVDLRDSQDSERYAVNASTSYAISDQFSVIGRASFRRLDDRRQVSILPKRTVTETTETFLGTLTLRYSFDPIIF